MMAMLSIDGVDVVVAEIEQIYLDSRKLQVWEFARLRDLGVYRVSAADVGPRQA